MCTAMRSIVHQLHVILSQKTFIFVEICKECNVTSTKTLRNIKNSWQFRTKMFTEPLLSFTTYKYSFHQFQVLIKLINKIS